MVFLLIKQVFSQAGINGFVPGYLKKVCNGSRLFIMYP
jgi:hypothetical protein